MGLTVSQILDLMDDKKVDAGGSVVMFPNVHEPLTDEDSDNEEEEGPGPKNPNHLGAGMLR